MTHPVGPAAEEDPRSDRALLAAHVDGDPTAFGVLVARHRDRLWAVALRTTGHREEAADGLQEGLVAAFRRAGSFRGDAAVTTWLHRVVVNACLDRMRASRVRAAEPLPEDEREHRPAAGPTAPDPSSEDPAVGAVRREDRDRVLAALATLPAEQRAALVLVDMEGFSVAEAAEVLGCATGTVKSRCSRGRARLAGLLADLVGPPPEPGAPPGNHAPAADVTAPGDPRGPPPADGTR